ncbi:MAG: hypothetical protein HY329_06475 [Chloroflexi bacterium]|nr:hypothetical protein [Chloroflexota bacterium]
MRAGQVLGYIGTTIVLMLIALSTTFWLQSRLPLAAAGGPEIQGPSAVPTCGELPPDKRAQYEAQKARQAQGQAQAQNPMVTPHGTEGGEPIRCWEDGRRRTGYEYLHLAIIATGITLLGSAIAIFLTLRRPDPLSQRRLSA